MLELCASRSNILALDEETVLRESKDLTISKVRQMIKQVIYFLLFEINQILILSLLLRQVSLKESYKHY